MKQNTQESYTRMVSIRLENKALLKICEKAGVEDKGEIKERPPSTVGGCAE
jgi:hypothetical protein